jgi:hypothetical protein
MQIEGDIATTYLLLNDPKPDGVTVEKSGGAFKAFNVNVNIIVDLSKISEIVAVSWILAKIALQSRSKIKVNGQLLPPDDAGARKMIMDAVHEEQKEKRDGN